MSVIGLDFGNQNCVVAVARKRGIDVIANEASKRETTTIVGFKEGVRAMGESAAQQQTGNMRNSIYSLKKLLGRKFSSPEVQSEIKNLPFTVKAGDNDSVEVEVRYKGEKQTFSPEQLVAMQLTRMVKIAEDDCKTKAKDVVISVPGYFTEPERHALASAASIAGLNCLQLLPEPIAIGISYAIYKKGLPTEEEAQKVLFVDVGASAASAFVAAVSDGKFRVLSAAYDRNLGGRDFDEALAQQFVKQIKEKYKMDVSENAKSMKRLRDACERAKKVFTTNPETVLNVESLMNDIDVSFPVVREDFEAMAKDQSDRCGALVKRAIEEAGIKPEDLHSVELIGSASRIVCLQNAIKEASGNELSHTMNKSECIARGAAIQCAILSPQFQVNKPWVAKDCLPYAIVANWKITKATGGDAMDTDDSSAPTTLTFARGSQVPTARKITFANAKRLEFEVKYADPSELPEGCEPTIGTFSFQNDEKNEDGSAAKIEAKIKINSSGCFELEYATASVRYNEIVKVEEVKDDKKADDKKEEKKKDDKAEEEKDAKEATPSEDVEMADGAKAEETTVKKKVKKVNLPIQRKYTGSLEQAELLRLQKAEMDMRQSDQIAVDTANSRNALESFVYDFQSKIQWEGTELHAFVTEEDRTAFLARLTEAGDWLYGDGEDASKDEYDQKLSQFKAEAAPIELRKNESETRGAAVEKLNNTLSEFNAWLKCEDEAYAHISAEDRKKVEDEVFKAQDWLNGKLEKQSSLPPTADPVLLTNEIEAKVTAVNNVCQPIRSQPKPAPKVEEKKEEEKKEEAKEEKKDDSAAPTEEAVKPADAMDVDTPAEVPAADMDLD